MSVIVVTPPATEPVTLAEAKAHLRVTYGLEDALITSLIAAARAYIENWCDRALITQVWKATRDAFCPEIRLTGGVVTAIQSVKYIDADGVEQTLDSSAYVADLDSVPARIWPAVGSSWPTTAAQPGAVRIQYAVGYADAAAVPAPIKAALLLVLGDLFENRQGQQAETLVENAAVSSLLWPYRRIVI